MAGPFKMKGWSPFTKLEEKKTFSTKEDQPKQKATDNKESDITEKNWKEKLESAWLNFNQKAIDHMGWREDFEKFKKIKSKSRK